MIRVMIAALALTLLQPASAQSLSRAAAERWLARYGEAWEARNADAAAALFTDDAQYFETPWAEPFDGAQAIGEYWGNVTADQSDVSFDFELLSVTGDSAIAHWNALFTIGADGSTLALDGIFVLEFADNDTVSELREWWVIKP